LTFGAIPFKDAPPASPSPELPKSGQCPGERGNKEPIVPKMKTNRAAAKRFRVTGSGRIRRSKGGGNHGMQEKSRKRLRRCRNNDMVDKTLEKKIKTLLCA
jgi:large subunit ribosomal protein L35